MNGKTTGTTILVAFGALVTLLSVIFRSVPVEAAYPAGNMRRTFVDKAFSRIRGFFRGAEAQAENIRLRREVAALAMLRGDIERLESENARLRRALGYLERHRNGWLAAQVISRGGAASARQFLRIDRGSLSGVREGAVAAVPEGLVGLVTAVTPHTADVTLLSDRLVKVACEVEGDGGDPLRGILSGGTEDRLEMRYLTGAEEVRPRSQVLTSGRGGVFPRGLSVGTLLGVRKGEQGLAREGEVLPAVDYSTLEDVFIRRED